MSRCCLRRRAGRTEREGQARGRAPAAASSLHRRATLRTHLGLKIGHAPRGGVCHRFQKRGRRLPAGARVSRRRGAHRPQAAARAVAQVGTRPHHVGQGLRDKGVHLRDGPRAGWGPLGGRLGGCSRHWAPSPCRCGSLVTCSVKNTPSRVPPPQRNAPPLPPAPSPPPAGGPACPPPAAPACPAPTPRCSAPAAGTSTWGAAPRAPPAHHPPPGSPGRPGRRGGGGAPARRSRNARTHAPPALAPCLHTSPFLHRPCPVWWLPAGPSTPRPPAHLPGPTACWPVRVAAWWAPEPAPAAAEPGTEGALPPPAPHLQPSGEGTAGQKEHVTAGGHHCQSAPDCQAQTTTPARTARCCSACLCGRPLARRTWILPARPASHLAQPVHRGGGVDGVHEVAGVTHDGENGVHAAVASRGRGSHAGGRPQARKGRAMLCTMVLHAIIYFYVYQNKWSQRHSSQRRCPAAAAGVPSQAAPLPCSFGTGAGPACSLGALRQQLVDAHVHVGGKPHALPLPQL